MPYFFTVMICLELALGLGISVISFNSWNLAELKLKSRKALANVNGCSDDYTEIPPFDDVSLLTEKITKASFIFALSVALVGYVFTLATAGICGLIIKAKNDI